MGTQGKVRGKPLDAVEAFIRRWQGCDEGQERANYAMFLHEHAMRSVPTPDPAGDPEMNDCVFERVVKEPGRDRRIFDETWSEEALRRRASPWAGQSQAILPTTFRRPLPPCPRLLPTAALRV